VLCPACNGTGEGRTVGRLRILTCTSCGHGWTPAQSDNNEHFESHAYVAWRASNQGWMDRTAAKVLDDLVEVTGRLPRSASEIGCATGEVLGALSRNGTDCWGVDLSEDSIAIARTRQPRVSFEVATMPDAPVAVEALLAFHVLEHVPDPVTLLKDAHTRVAKHGVLYLRVPNYGGLARRALGDWWPDYLPGHLHHFTEGSITRCLERSGWHPASIRTRSRAWAWLGGLKRLLARSRPGDPRAVGAAPPGGRRLQALELADRLFRPLLYIEERLGLGNELVIVATKR
jgi:SAM-dependent methyltransferase